MGNFNKTLKLAFLGMIMTLGIFIFTGCGPTIDTVFYINNNLSGMRQISVSIPKSELNNAGADMRRINNILQEYTPMEMNYSIDDSDDIVSFDFDIGFNDIGEYRTKVSNILSASTDINPTIIIDGASNEFKTGVKVRENFSSYDLMLWFYNALRSEGLIDNTDYSKWITINSTILKFDGIDYTCSPIIDMDELIDHGLDKIDITTYFLPDGTFKRKIDFTISSANEKYLMKSGHDLYKIISLKQPKDSTISTYEANGKRTVSVIFPGADTERIEQGTNKLLSANNTEFEVTTANSEEAAGLIELSIKDYCDTKYYLSSVGKENNYEMYYDFEQAVQKEGEFVSHYQGEKLLFKNNIKTHKTVNSVFSVPLMFDEAELKLSGSNKIKADLILTLINSSRNLNTANSENALKTSVNSVNESFPDKCSLNIKKKTDKTVYTITIKSMNAEDFSEAFSKFIERYSGKKDTCKIEISKMINKKTLNNTYLTEIKIDVSDLVINEANFSYVPSATAEVLAEKSDNNVPENAYNTYIDTNDGFTKFNVTVKNYSLVGLIPLIIIVVIILLIILSTVLYFIKMSAKFINPKDTIYKNNVIIPKNNDTQINVKGNNND